MTNNEQTKAQIRRWIENAIKEARNPDLRKQLKKQREQKKKIVAKLYGF